MILVEEIKCGPQVNKGTMMMVHDKVNVNVCVVMSGSNPAATCKHAMWGPLIYFPYSQVFFFFFGHSLLPSLIVRDGCDIMVLVLVHPLRPPGDPKCLGPWIKLLKILHLETMDDWDCMNDCDCIFKIQFCLVHEWIT